MPAEMETEEHAVHDALVEGIVVGDDDLMERYLGDETDRDRRSSPRALAAGIATGTVFPVLCGSATKLIGIDRLAHVPRRRGARADGRRRRDRPRSCSRRSSTRTSGA